MAHPCSGRICVGVTPPKELRKWPELGFVLTLKKSVDFSASRRCRGGMGSPIFWSWTEAVGLAPSWSGSGKMNLASRRLRGAVVFALLGAGEEVWAYPPI